MASGLAAITAESRFGLVPASGDTETSKFLTVHKQAILVRWYFFSVILLVRFISVRYVKDLDIIAGASSIPNGHSKSDRVLSIYQFIRHLQSFGSGRHSRSSLMARRRPRVNQESLPRASLAGWRSGRFFRQGRDCWRGPTCRSRPPNRGREP